jgi:hypothetical protein
MKGWEMNFWNKMKSIERGLTRGSLWEKLKLVYFYYYPKWLYKNFWVSILFAVLIILLFAGSQTQGTPITKSIRLVTGIFSLLIGLLLFVGVHKKLSFITESAYYKLYSNYDIINKNHRYVTFIRVILYIFSIFLIINGLIYICAYFFPDKFVFLFRT